MFGIGSDDSANCLSELSIYPTTVSFTQSIIGTWMFFGFNYKHGSSKYYMLSLFNNTPLTAKSDTTNGQNLWNTSGNHYIEFGSTRIHTLVGDFSLNDVRLYINYDSEGYDLLNTVRLQMNSLCVVGCKTVLTLEPVVFARLAFTWTLATATHATTPAVHAVKQARTAARPV
jgi:hypothetical protein